MTENLKLVIYKSTGIAFFNKYITSLEMGTGYFIFYQFVALTPLMIDPENI